MHEYENWLSRQNISKTTVGMYLRPLRTIFNEAIEEGIIIREKYYPFSRHKYRIPASKNTKKALDLTDVKKIYYYKCDPKNDSEHRAKDYWLFSYFANGMNPKDIACLKYKNIHDDMKAIIERWGNKDHAPNNYIFPVMEIGISPYGNMS